MRPEASAHSGTTERESCSSAESSTSGHGYPATKIPEEPSRLVANAVGYGQKIAAVSDGTSKTFGISEAKASTSWWNGRGLHNTGYFNGAPTVLANTLPTGGTTARYTAAGPNSDHQYKILIHGYVDGHVGAVPEDIDQAVFGALFSRSNGEPTGEQP